MKNHHSRSFKKNSFRSPIKFHRFDDLLKSPQPQQQQKCALWQFCFSKKCSQKKSVQEPNNINNDLDSSNYLQYKNMSSPQKQQLIKQIQNTKKHKRFFTEEHQPSCHTQASTTGLKYNQYYRTTKYRKRNNKFIELTPKSSQIFNFQTINQNQLFMPSENKVVRNKQKYIKIKLSISPSSECFFQKRDVSGYVNNSHSFGETHLKKEH